MGWVVVADLLVVLLQGMLPPSGWAQEPPTAAGAAATAQAEEALPVTLQGLIQEALQQNPGVQAKKRAYEAARARVITAWFPNDPEVGTDVEGQSKAFRFDRIDNEYMLSQSVPFPLKLFFKAQMASKGAAIAYQDYQAKRREVTWHIEQPYYELYVANKTLTVLEELRVILERLVSATQARYEANRASQQDLLKATIELSKLSTERFAWQQKAHLAEAHFSYLLNRPLGTRYRIVEETPGASMPWSYAELEQLALRSRPELKALELGIQRAKANDYLAMTNWLPDLTGRIEARQFSGEGNIREYDTFLGLTVPVWSVVKGLGGEWKSARREVQAAEAAYVEMKNEVFLEIHEAYAKAQTAQQALNVYEPLILPQATQQFEVALSAYRAGTTDFLALIDAQRMLKDVQMTYYTLKAEYALGLSNLRLAVGTDLPPGNKPQATSDKRAAP